MIVVGVDPGARETGLAIVRYGDGELLDSATIRRPARSPVLDVEPEYLFEVASAVAAAVDPDVALLAVERVQRPAWRVAGKVKPTDPSAIIATGIVFGAILGRAWPVPVVIVDPHRNGSRPFGTYPPQLVTEPERRGTGWELRPAGDGKLRHERSAYDVACRAPMLRSVSLQTGRIYT